MNQLACYLEKTDEKLISEAEKAVKLSVDAPEHREHKKIANKIEEELTKAKNNFKLLSNEVNPVEFNITHFMLYNGNIMSIKQLLYRFNLKK